MKTEIKNFIAERLLSGKIVTEDENLLLSGLIDSLGVMQLVRFLEETYQIKIPAEDVTITHFITIDAITLYVQQRQNY